jgi:hypothetical protein
VTLRPQGAAVQRCKGWQLRVDERELLVQGRPVKIGRPAYLLLALVEGQGRVVSKDDLAAAAWAGRDGAGRPATGHQRHAGDGPQPAGPDQHHERRHRNGICPVSAACQEGAEVPLRG